MRRFEGLIVICAALALVMTAGCARKDLIAQQGGSTSAVAELPEPVAAAAAETEETAEVIANADGEEVSSAPSSGDSSGGREQPGAPQSPTSSASPAAPVAPGTSATPAPAATAPAPSAAAPQAEPEGTVVLGAITVVSHVPQPSEVPYSDCLTMIKYKVERVESGDYSGGELLAAFWGMRNARLEPPARFRVGQRHRLIIEPLSKHPELSRVMQADDTNEYTLTPYWVIRYSDA